MVNYSERLPAVEFYDAMREEIEQTIEQYQNALNQLNDPKIDELLICPDERKMQKIELTILQRIWEQTGTLPNTTLNYNTAKYCLRFASSDFHNGFKSVEDDEDTELDYEIDPNNFIRLLAEHSDPKMNYLLVGIFSRAIEKLRNLEKLCKL